MMCFDGDFWMILSFFYTFCPLSANSGALQISNIMTVLPVSFRFKHSGLALFLKSTMNIRNRIIHLQ